MKICKTIILWDLKLLPQKTYTKKKMKRKKFSFLQKIRKILSLGGEDGALKLLLFFMSLGALRGEPCTIVFTGQTVKRRRVLIRSVTRLYPENYVYTNSETGLTCRKSLIHRNWKSERILVLTNFEDKIY